MLIFLPRGGKAESLISRNFFFAADYPFDLRVDERVILKKFKMAIRKKKLRIRPESIRFHLTRPFLVFFLPSPIYVKVYVNELILPGLKALNFSFFDFNPPNPKGFNRSRRFLFIFFLPVSISFSL